jgi:HK97 family phage major capsid protein
MSNLTMERDTLRKQLVEKKALLDRIQEGGVKDETGKGHFVVSPEARRDFTKTMGEAKEIKTRLAELGEYEALDSYLNDPGEDPTHTGGPKGGVQRVTMGQFKSLGERFLESKEYKERDPATGFTRSSFVIEEDLSALERKDIYTAAGGTMTRFGFGRVETEPLVQRPYRTDRVRDLFPVAQTSGNLIEYMRVLGYLDGQNNARPVAERETDADDSPFGLKPHTRLKLQPAQAPIRTIAHYEVAHRNTLDDEPMLRSIIDTELLYGLRLVEDDQVLNGDGNGENLLGILRTPGIQNYPGAVTPSPVQDTDTYIDAVRRAATRVMLAYYSPTGVVVHPYDWETMELTKDAQRGYVLALNVAVGAEKRIWQMPVVASPAMNQGVGLVGAFGLGAKIYDRQQSNIRIAEQHADLFIRNAIAILAEQRLGLTVSRPESFIKIDLPGSVPAEG